MTDFTISLAGRNIGISALFESTRTFCKDYLSDGIPDFTVSVTPSDIEYERQRGASTDKLEGVPVRSFTDSYLETLSVYRKIAEEMLNYDTFLFHGSAVAVDGQAFLFTAKSGTGKSTHTRFWRQEFGDRAIMVNDDKPLLKITENGVLVCGTPWDGKHRLSTNTMVPLKGLCILQRGEENVIEPITAHETLPMLLQQSYRTQSSAGLAKLLELLDRLTQSVDFYRLSCNLDPAAARVAYEGMCR